LTFNSRYNTLDLVLANYAHPPFFCSCKDHGAASFDGKAMQNEHSNNAENNFQTMGCPVAFWRFDSELKHVQVKTATPWMQSAYFTVGTSIEWKELPEEPRKLWEQRILKVFQTGWQFIMEDRISDKRGLHWFQSTYIPEFNVDRDVVAVLVICCDLSAVRQATEEDNQLKTLVSASAVRQS